VFIGLPVRAEGARKVGLENLASSSAADTQPDCNPSALITIALLRCKVRLGRCIVTLPSRPSFDLEAVLGRAGGRRGREGVGGRIGSRAAGMESPFSSVRVAGEKRYHR
jgi:hypothetical protein